MRRRGEVVAEAHEEPEVLGEQPGGAADGLDRGERAVGPDLDDELVPLGLLTDAGLLDEEVGLADRREDGVDRDHADRLALVLVALRGDVALAALDHEVHAQLRLRRVERAMCCSGLRISTSLGHSMSAAVTSCGPC